MPAPQKLHDQIDTLHDSTEYTGTGVLVLRLIVNQFGVRRTEAKFERQLDGEVFVVGNPCIGCQK